MYHVTPVDVCDGQRGECDGRVVMAGHTPAHSCSLAPQKLPLAPEPPPVPAPAPAPAGHCGAAGVG
jgi:hypothetical protein